MGVEPKPRRQHVGRTWRPWRRRRLERASDLAHLEPAVWDSPAASQIRRSERMSHKWSGWDGTAAWPGSTCSGVPSPPLPPWPCLLRTLVSPPFGPALRNDLHLQAWPSGSQGWPC